MRNNLVKDKGRQVVTAERVLAQVRASATAAGYETVPHQPSLFEGEGTESDRVADMLPRGASGQPHIRVFRVEKGTHPELQALQRATAVDGMPFVALTHDGKTFQLFSSQPGSTGSLPFLVKSPEFSRGLRNVRKLEDCQPITSIADLRRLVSVLNDKIYAAHGHDRLRLFDTVLILLATKIHDELEHEDALEIPRWAQSPRRGLTERVREQASKALEKIGCAEYAKELDLTDEAMAEALALLAPYSLRLTIRLDSQAEVLGTFYQETVSSTFRGSLGAYFTPKPVADLASVLCSPRGGDSIFDVSCGSATFLLSAAGKVAANQAAPVMFGCDIQERMVVTSAINCMLHGIETPHIIHSDGLKVDLADWHEKDDAVPRRGFSLIVGNPPFAGFETSMKTPAEAEEGGGQRGSGARVHKIIPFVEKVLELLAPSGRAALVVPTSVLNGEANAFRRLRRHLGERAHVTALIGLPKDAFVHTDCGVEGALLLFKKTGKVSAEDRTFFWRVRDLGYDRRGRVRGQADFHELIAAWESGAERCHVQTTSLYEMDRWDVPWLEAWSRGDLRFSSRSHVPLTKLCRVVPRQFSKRELLPNETYSYFEVSDTEIDSGRIVRTHRAPGRMVLEKGRLRQRVRTGDVLLPNHRDSLIAKTAAGIGRSAVLVPPELDGCITTDRFTILEPLIDPVLLIAVLGSRTVRTQLALHSRGSASFDIRDRVLDDVRVPKGLIENGTLASEMRALFERREALLADLEGTRKAIESLINGEAQPRGTAHRA